VQWKDVGNRWKAFQHLSTPLYHLW
jgi:hypothetical protein